jgi:hypothetical protein
MGDWLGDDEAKGCGIVFVILLVIAFVVFMATA